jgi:hypothetical protein
MNESFWQDRIEAIGQSPFGVVRDKLENAARVAGVSMSKLRRIYYRETAEPKWSDGQKIVAAAEKYAPRLLSIAEHLERTDADFYRAEISRLRGLAYRVGAMGSDGAVGQKAGDRK